MSPKAKVIRLAQKKALIRAKDLESRGISRNYLYSLYKDGILERVGTGSYALADALPHPYDNLIEISHRSPLVVISHISALAFHELTTQIPSRLWITLPRGTWVPKWDNPPLMATLASGDSYSYGIELHKIDGHRLKIYSPAKTVADCFKYRRKVGLDIAIEALKDVLTQAKATPDELMSAAKVNRVANVMRPYVEALV